MFVEQTRQDPKVASYSYQLDRVPNSCYLNLTKKDWDSLRFGLQRNSQLLEQSQNALQKQQLIKRITF
jgi:hypothetical protein